MKRFIACVLVLCLAVGLCACGAKKDAAGTADAYVKVFLKDGTTETFDLKTLPAMVKEDPDTYNEKYARNKMEMATRITNVELDYELLSHARVTFDGPFNCYIRKDAPIIGELEIGQSVKVSGTLIMDGWTIYNATITVVE